MGLVTGHWLRLVGCIALAASVSACAETSLQDTFGAGKVVPDATQVPTNQALTMPPDLQLRPPGSAPTPSAQPAVPGAAMPEAQQAYVPPPSGQPLALETAQEAGVAPPPAPEPVEQASQYPQTAVATNVAPAPAPAATGDIYDRYGISKTNPDGTPKSPGQMREELRQKQIAEKQAQNPSYGTIFNIGSIWSDQ